MILCGNKIDLVREVKTSEGEELEKREGILRETHLPKGEVVNLYLM